jgi:ribose/xylose/arabinose/galactoside ABC-type transport system permease subunit
MAVDQGSSEETAPVELVQSAHLGDGSSRSTFASIGALGARHALLLGFVVMVVVFSLIRRDAFLSVGNIRNILIQSSVVMVGAVPTSFLLIAGKVDLAIGSTFALGAVVSGLLVTNGFPAVAAIAAGLAVGALIGVIIGFFVSYLELSPIIVTLGMLAGGRGLAEILAPNTLYGFGDTFEALGESGIAGAPWSVLIALVIATIGAAALYYTPTGRHVYALGVNQEAAFLSGIRVKPLVLVLYVCSGVLAALAGIMLSARIDSAPAGSLGLGYELDVLTAVLLGGIAFDGGRGTIFGAMLGVLFLAVLQDGMILQNVPTSYALWIKGMALVAAAGLDRITTRLNPLGA